MFNRLVHGTGISKRMLKSLSVGYFCWLSEYVGVNLIVFYKRPNRSMVAMRGMSQVSKCRSRASQTDANLGGLTDQRTGLVFTLDNVDPVIYVGSSLYAVSKGA